MNKHYVSWIKFGGLCESIKNQIEKSNEKYSYLHPVPRGGYPLATYLSNHLNIPFCQSRNQLLELFEEGRILVVDDISDTGKTLEQTLDMFKWKEYDIATLHYRVGSKIKPKFYGEMINDDSWIVYPFEPREKVSKRDNTEV